MEIQRRLGSLNESTLSSQGYEAYLFRLEASMGIGKWEMEKQKEETRNRVEELCFIFFPVVEAFTMIHTSE